nr:unnamed protein product [Callosobruchus chinensis]
MYLYDKWECLSLIDINSVLFIYSSEVINLSMMILIFFNIECIHFIQTTMKSPMFSPKSQAQVADARKWNRIAGYFHSLFFSANMILSITVIFVAVWRNEQILAAHKPSILHWKVFFVFQVCMLDKLSLKRRTKHLKLNPMLLLLKNLQNCIV